MYPHERDLCHAEQEHCTLRVFLPPGRREQPPRLIAVRLLRKDIHTDITVDELFLDRGGVERAACIVAQVETPPCRSHRPDPHILLGEEDVGAADARRPVSADGCQNMMRVGPEDALRPCREVGLSFGELRPGDGAGVQHAVPIRDTPTR